MALKLVNGDYYIRPSGQLMQVSGAEEIAQRITFKLQARRGMFPFLPELGSRLYTLGSVKPSRRKAAAEAYILEALEGETITLEEVELETKGETLVIRARILVGDVLVNTQVEV